MRKANAAYMIFALFAMSLVLTGCEEDEAERVSSAQQCLNDMNAEMTEAELSSKADECRTILGTPTTEEAYMVECSSYFLEEGFFGSKILEAFDRVDEQDGDNALLAAASVFVFSGAAGSVLQEDRDNADAAQVACAQSGVAIYELFGGLAQTATLIGNIGVLNFSGELPTEAEFEAALNNLTSSGDLEDLGETIVTLAESVCGEGSLDLGDDVCPTLDSVVAGGDNEVIGQCVQQCMVNPPGHVCTDDSSIVCP